MKALVIGCGRVGSTIALNLHNEGWEVTVVDENEDALSRLGESWRGAFVVGHGMDTDLLREAGIEDADAVVAAEAPAHSPDEAWIETARCPSCNECQLINDRMFTYDERKQAYIKDITAGTYRQLVEAAESCQVAIIHPGKPRDPNEPGLAELLERAAPFR